MEDASPVQAVRARRDPTVAQPSRTAVIPLNDCVGAMYSSSVEKSLASVPPCRRGDVASVGGRGQWSQLGERGHDHAPRGNCRRVDITG